jgi:hypothetical protein
MGWKYTRINTKLRKDFQNSKGVWIGLESGKVSFWHAGGGICRSFNK